MPYSIKKWIHKKSLCLLCIVICLFFACLAEAQNAQVSFTKEEKKWIVEHPTIRLGVGIAFQPFMWSKKKMCSQNSRGMVSDYIELLEEELGVEMQVIFNIPLMKPWFVGARAR